MVSDCTINVIFVTFLLIGCKLDDEGAKAIGTLLCINSSVTSLDLSCDYNG